MAADVAKDLRELLVQDGRIDLSRSRIEIDFADGVATVAGEAADVAAKRRVLEIVARAPVVRKVMDRLSVRTAERHPDEAILDHVFEALLADPIFAECGIGRHVGVTLRALRPAAHASWWIELRVEDGVVTLDGLVSTLLQTRLAEAIAWWTPGTRNVINTLDVERSATDGDQEILNALRLILERDPRIDASRLGASCKDSIVTLEGVVPSDVQREAAEFDAWVVFGVHDVLNGIRIEPRSPSG
jgi:osmotically-inducible protein OsmY